MKKSSLLASISFKILRLKGRVDSKSFNYKFGNLSASLFAVLKQQTKSTKKASL
jgi:hypothetical protein